MYRKALSAMTVLFAVSLLATSGCSKSYMDLDYQSQDLSYRVTQEVAKEVIFEQPSIDKSKTDTVKTVVEMEYTQSPLGFSDETAATLLDITVTDLKYFSQGKNGVNTDFDYSRGQDKNKPLAAIVGQSYKIEVAPDGSVSVVDATDARKACTARELKALLSDDSIIARHKSYYYKGATQLKKGAAWSTVVASPKGSLDQKNFEKVYTVNEIVKNGDKKIAHVNMSANVTNKEPENGEDTDGAAQGMGFMAGIFDNTNIYTGNLVFDTTEGVPVLYDETLVAEYVAAEEPRTGDKTKGPDVLTMRFTNIYKLEMVK
ncbi:hypothetical protein SMSP2_01001 [Limihaloglobus sulfuriphilus]|uniref:Uncharacterized protein n=1 Tax=Limihaloglobus sulfuriphilus TaxID=1851148 RepID=A0A1Q2MD70_9BACT|nr:hypothetical protein [Limihaloglobus sulfuriphilus]AQQ70646.1 hypothetical protein SMSP2_01001 [Limihaloglobus sulfuriphilus]